MNKSLLTNLIAAAIALSALLLDEGQARSIMLNAGLFALSGAFTNWLAITMLFERVPFLYGSGVIPSRFEDFKAGIHTLIMGQFFTKENVERLMASEAASTVSIDTETLVKAVPMDRAFDRIVEVVLESKLGGMLGMFGGPKVLETMRPSIEEALKGVIEEVARSEKFQKGFASAMKAGASSMSEDIVSKVDGIVKARLDELTPDDVKRIIQDMIRKHLGWLVVWGGVFGGLIGILCAVLL